MEGIVIQLLKAFIIRQVNKWGAEVDWELVKVDWAERSAAILPYDILDGVAKAVSGEFIDLLKAYFTAAAGLEINAKSVEQAISAASSQILRKIAEKWVGSAQ